jgi:nucleoside-diphosphate-sugar epimerase
MKIFVAGATGVLGRRAVAQLVAAGHEVTGVARTEEKAAQLHALGVTPVTVDLFDAGALKDAVAGHDVVMNLATHIPNLSKAALPGAWSENDRIRSEASRNLVDAALAAGAKRYVQEAISFLYEDRGADWIDEDVPLDVPALGGSQLAAEAETKRFTDSGGTGVVLRFGQFYAPEAAHTIAMAKMVRRRIAPSLGSPDAFVTAINADDAASAVVAALQAPAGVYNVTDDDPVTRKEYGETVAAALGRKAPRNIPPIIAKAGGSKSEYLMRSMRVSNRKFKEATGWAPAYPSVREGWPVIAAAMKEG